MLTIPTLMSAIQNPKETFGPRDSTNSAFNQRNKLNISQIQVGIVEQFNVGMYSALVGTSTAQYVCAIGAYNISPGFGYSDATILREGDEVIFSITSEIDKSGIILARRPALHSVDSMHPIKVTSDTQLERRTHFFADDCYRRNKAPYEVPLHDPKDFTTLRYMNNRPTDLVAGETGSINAHRCGILGGLYSTTLVGGGAQIRLFSLENRIRVVAESIIKYTFNGNDNEWHNRRYLSHEKAECLYQEERLGLSSKEQPAFREADYHKEGYFTANREKKQTLRPRIVEHTGYYGGLVSKYCLRPDPHSAAVRTMSEEVHDPGVARESIDPSGQYRLATTGMLGFERVGRIPVPVRVKYPWQQEAKEPKATTLEEFKHDQENPYYRQLELADRVAFDLKNSYARVDEAESEFFVPEEKDLEGKLKDVYDPGFSGSKTVRLEKYDKRRSGIWQGEDGSIILRDAWGSEIVMIGGNIQLSCAGNIEILPGKTALTLAGDDIVHKAQNSIDISAADKDVRINAFKNVQVLAGADESKPGGIILEAKGKAFPWDADDVEGGEQVVTSGIVLKSHDGAIATDTKTLVLRAEESLSVMAGKDTISEGDGRIMIGASNLSLFADSIIENTPNSSLMMSKLGTTFLGESFLLASRKSTSIFSGSKILIPLMWYDIGTNLVEEFSPSLDKIRDQLSDEEIISRGYSYDRLETMHFKFRSSSECGTDKAWELNSPDDFMLFEPFWVQVHTKFETLTDAGVQTASFEDHTADWPGDIGHPWPGTDVATGKGFYVKLDGDGPANMTDQGLNKARSEVVDHSVVTKVPLFPLGYKVRQ